MNNIKTVFSVKDLENLSGIKAHTIRIWEKRYEIFTPNRNENNTRLYTSEELMKLLNIALLNKHGYKISKLATFTDGELEELVKEASHSTNSTSVAISTFKYAMFNFDANLFHTTYSKLKETQTFAEIFYEVFMPLLDEIGVLWQTNSIKPIHEHFISCLISQKLYVAIDTAQNQATDLKKEFIVLFLPLHEIHALGLLFLHYLLLEKGYKVIYLGENVPLEDLKKFSTYFEKVTFVSYFTIEPRADKIDEYLTSFQEEVLHTTKNRLFYLGKQQEYATIQSNSVTAFQNIKKLLEVF